MLDTAATGPLWLNDPEIAGYVERALKQGAELRHYVLRAYVIMPNHVHVLLDPLVDLYRLTGGIKGVSARDANVRLGRTGKPFWQDESFDHWIRDAGQFTRTRSYIENNPVKARLCAKPEDWRWSSAPK
jgi:REP element-mobilizing transposase RayT